MDLRDPLGLPVTEADAGWDGLVVCADYCSPSFALEWLRKYRNQEKSLRVITAANSPSSAARFACLSDLAARWPDSSGMSAELLAEVQDSDSGIYSFVRGGKTVLSFRYPRPFSKEWWTLGGVSPSPREIGGLEHTREQDQASRAENVGSVSWVPPGRLLNGYRGLQDSLALEAQSLAPATSYAVDSTLGRSLRLSLLSQSGEVHAAGGGLNWGLPSKTGRQRSNPNEAYVPVPRAAASTGFFPGHNEPFDVYTDDGRLLVMRVGGGDGFKDLTTPFPNSALGAYIRGRLGLAGGAQVSTEHLIRYGRTFVDFTRLAPSTYYVDFSVPIGSAVWNYTAPESDSPLTGDGHR